MHIIINRVGNKWIPQHIPGDESVSLVPSWFLPSHYYNKTQHTKMKNTWFKCISSQVDKNYLNKIIALSTLYFHWCSMMLGSRQVLSDCLRSEYIKCKSGRQGILQMFQCPVVSLVATGSSLGIMVGWWLLILLDRQSWGNLDKQIEQWLKRNPWAQYGASGQAKSPKLV